MARRSFSLPPCGGGSGWGVQRCGTSVPHFTTPTPDPSPQGGGEKKTRRYVRLPNERVASMSGLGGLNKTPNGVVIGLVQLQLPVVATPADLAKQTETSVAMVGKARRN